MSAIPLLPPDEGTYDIGSAAKPWHDTVLSGSLTDASGNASTPAQIKTARTQAATAIPASQKGAASGVAELDANGRVPSEQLPSYVDDVLEYASTSFFPETGTSGIIYIALDTSIGYRWGGTAYAEISPSLALGSTSATAHRGDHGATAYSHSQDVTTNPHGVTAAQAGAIPAAEKGAASGVATLGANGLVPPSQLPASGSALVATTVTIATGDWSAGSATKALTGMTTTANVWASPNAASYAVFANAGMRCTAQASNSLTFTCDSVPASSVTVIISYMEPTA